MLVLPSTVDLTECFGSENPKFRITVYLYKSDILISIDNNYKNVARIGRQQTIHKSSNFDIFDKFENIVLELLLQATMYWYSFSELSHTY
jgi:hypothetical protein